jgi:hypothetical protein
VQQKVERESNKQLDLSMQKKQSTTKMFQENWNGDPDLLDIVKFNKDAIMACLTQLEINLAAKRMD